MSIDCYFDDVSERDMDMLFLEEFVCSDEFLDIFTDEAGIGRAKVLSVQASKTDILLGESDMTVIVEADGKKIGLLIEDKIDAIAMPEQAARYTLRGKKGIAQGEYDGFFVFIVAPDKYLSQNAEAQKYPHRIGYERILSYFENLNDRRSAFKIRQIRQAVEKQKKGYQVEMDPAVTDFWREYAAYQKEHHPGLLLVYNGEIKGSNATWPRFDTVTEGLYMYHKTQFGFIDLTFDGCAEKILLIEKLLSDSIGDWRESGFTVHKTGKSAAVRLYVPVVDPHKAFDAQKDAIKICFEEICRMSAAARRCPYSAVAGLLGK